MSKVNLFLLIFISFNGIAEEFTAEKTAAINLVGNAAAFVKKNGNDAGIKELNNPKGKFVDSALYVFAYDTAGMMVAHPINSKLVGKNMLEVPDVDGKLFRKEIIATALKSKTGWVDYKYKNPVNGQIENKTTYLQLVNNLILCCGVYK
jgi:signal transduction histidine kinase